MKIKRLPCIGIIVLMVGVICMNWIFYHFCSRKPQLLFTLPADECTKLFFTVNYTWGSDVRQICKEHGYNLEYTFATLEKKAICFIHGSGGYYLKYDNGEEGIVYFYKYNKRFRRFIEEP